MNIGVICEGSYTDRPLLEKVLSHKFPKTQFCIHARDKKAIFFPCYEDINSLISKKVTHIAILWDLLPVGHQMAIASQWSEKPNRGEQRRMLIDKLANSGHLNTLAKNAVKNLACRYGFCGDETILQTSVTLQLICVCYAIDGWLLSDEYVLKKLASTSSHQVSELTPSPEAPDRCQNPAGLLTRLFRSAPNRRYRFYNKHSHNEDIVNAYIENNRLDKMRASSSYARLIDTFAAWGAS